MAAVASPIPAGFMAGVTTDAPWQPLAECGYDNPFFYHCYAEDFDENSKTLSNVYTVTATGTGAAVAAQAGEGGQALFTAGTTAGNSSIQLPFASFRANRAPKKLFFNARLQATAAALTTATLSLVCGLIQLTATPGTVTDGVWFNISNGVVSINSAVGSVITTVNLPSSIVTAAVVANTFFDLGFYVNRQGDVLAFLDTQLVGYIPQSNLGTTGNPQATGAVARITAPAATAVNLTPTMGIVQGGTTAGATMTVDFFGAYQER